jgi:large subunit ribosomal protein LP0
MNESIEHNTLVEKFRSTTQFVTHCQPVNHCFEMRIEKQSRDMKLILMKKFKLNIDLYERIFIISTHEVTSQQIAQVRQQIGNRGALDMTKNSIMLKALKEYIDNNCARADVIKPLMNLLHNNAGVLFTDMSIDEIDIIFSQLETYGYIKCGAIAKTAAIIPAGTRVALGSTSFFGALGIPFKISRGMAEIVRDVRLLKPGETVSKSMAVLLEQLNIKSVCRRLRILQVYEYGMFYDPVALEKTINYSEAMANVVAMCKMTGTEFLPTVIVEPDIVLRKRI